MELSEKYKLEIANLRKAIASFELSLSADFKDLDEIGLDLIKNGRIQKFEYCTELAWKVCKIFLEIDTGLIANSPKQVYRGMFQSALIGEDQFLALNECIDNRNKLSHIYREEMYNLIYADLPRHLMAYKELLSVLE